MAAARSVNLVSRDGVAFTVETGALCIDVLYTGGLAERAQWETLRSPEDLQVWVEGASVFWGPIVVPVTNRDLADIVSLREAIWKSVNRVIDGDDPAVSDVDSINIFADRSAPRPRLEEGTIVTVGRTDGAAVVGAIARDAIELLGSPRRERLRRCHATDCALVFLDTSRAGARRWCSMARCGNRAKARTRRRTEQQ
ncbi:hypothetical protein CH304_02185 [Rhodococcus sp. 15-649-1-2]|nr:ABATE domain-containing protein [Rhodococcus sp. 15-649-1-2]OZE87022.1 hypothetical protein CH304_02185 [Rhodococcus sp. 15-649-1-2]